MCKQFNDHCEDTVIKTEVLLNNISDIMMITKKTMHKLEIISCVTVHFVPKQSVLH